MSIVPKVSVSIITYNHEKYIARTIDSVLAQQTDFDFEIIIGDDCSNDGTCKILETYKAKYPSVIQLILHPKRYEGVPGRLNNITNLYACRGTYVALLDGDDFWLDHHKLQRQVDFMESSPDFTIIANDAAKITQDGDFTEGRYGEEHASLRSDNTFTHEDVLRAGWCLTQTSSLLFRNKMFQEFPDWFWNIISADFGLLLLLSQHGKIKYLQKPLTAYRIHEDSFMTRYFFSKKILALKVAELRILRKTFLPYTPNSKGFRNLWVSYTLNRKIAVFKYSYAAHVKKDRGTVAALGYLTRSALSDFSAIFFLRMAIAKTELSSRA
jgi:glycosyltransferase involved in cell wall biosynthesis